MENERRCNLEKYDSCAGCRVFSYIEHQRRDLPKEKQREITKNLSVLCPPGLQAQLPPNGVGK